MSLTKTLGRVLAIAGAGAGLTSRALGQILGEETHILTPSEGPLHTHPNTLSDPGHLHTLNGRALGTFRADGVSAVVGTQVQNGNTGDTSTNSATTGMTINNATNSAGGAAHNNMQPTSFMNAMIKL